MVQSNLPKHVAIIMDGNGRWATARGRPRLAGHRAGAAAVREVVRGARRQGVGVLTLFAFSADNWRRPVAEVRGLLALFARFLRSEAPELRREGIALTVLGRRDRLPAALRARVAEAEALTAGGTAMRLRIAIDHSGRDAILRAAAAAGGMEPGRARFDALVAAADGDPVPAGPVDLLIRTGGERRLSDFLLWDTAYAELCFVDRPWPAFREADLDAALADFGRRERRFGGLPTHLEVSA
jgi:undecaprenyl diphosphate synthase